MLGAFKVLVQQVVKRMRRTVPVQNFPWPIVEHHLYPLDLASRQPREPRPFGEELAQQAVGVLICAPLPGGMRMGKIDPHLGLLGEEAMLTHFGSLVVGEGATKLSRQRPQFAREGLPHRGRVLGLQRHQQGKPRGPLHQGPKCRGIGMAHEQVALPMSWYSAIHNFGWPLVDTDEVLNRA